jgi:hypothetical protein
MKKLKKIKLVEVDLEIPFDLYLKLSEISQSCGTDIGTVASVILAVRMRQLKPLNVKKPSKKPKRNTNA